MDSNVIDRFLTFVKIPPDVLVLEVGPGLGFLTEGLLERGHRVMGVEIDGRSVNILRKRFGLSEPIRKEIHWVDALNRSSSFLLHEGDIRKFTLADLEAVLHRTGYECAFVIGTLPYHITSSLMFKSYEWSRKLRGMGLVVQREVGERILSREGMKQYGILSVMTRYYYGVTRGFVLNEQVFYPSPRVKSLALRFERRKHTLLLDDERLFSWIVKAAFNQRRKHFHKALETASITSFSKEVLREVFERYESLKYQRADSISMEDYIHFTNHYSRLLNVFEHGGAP